MDFGIEMSRYRMFYQDCIAQLGFLFCLLLAYLLLLVAHPHYVEDKQVSICIQFRFISLIAHEHRGL